MKFYYKSISSFLKINVFLGSMFLAPSLFAASQKLVTQTTSSGATIALNPPASVPLSTPMSNPIVTARPAVINDSKAVRLFRIAYHSTKDTPTTQSQTASTLKSAAKTASGLGQMSQGFVDPQISAGLGAVGIGLEAAGSVVGMGHTLHEFSNTATRHDEAVYDAAQKVKEVGKKAAEKVTEKASDLINFLIDTLKKHKKKKKKEDLSDNMDPMIAAQNRANALELLAETRLAFAVQEESLEETEEERMNLAIRELRDNNIELSEYELDTIKQHVNGMDLDNSRIEDTRDFSDSIVHLKYLKNKYNATDPQETKERQGLEQEINELHKEIDRMHHISQFDDVNEQREQIKVNMTILKKIMGKGDYDQATKKEFEELYNRLNEKHSQIANTTEREHYSHYSTASSELDHEFNHSRDHILVEEHEIRTHMIEQPSRGFHH